MAVQAWTLEQLSKLRRYQPEMVDHALEEMLERQADLFIEQSFIFHLP